MWHLPGLIADSGRVCEHPSMADDIARRGFMNGIAPPSNGRGTVAQLVPKREVNDAHVSKVI